jgi:serine/threonine protein kinase
MATGQLPFRGDSTATIFDAILNRAPVPAVRLNPDLPADLERIINRALEKDRELRCQHASDMRAELQRVKRDTESERSVSASSGSVPIAREVGSQVTQQALPVSAVSVAPTNQKAPEVNESSKNLCKILIAAAAILVAAIGGWLYFRSHPTATHPATTAPTEKDTIVLADFDNRTGGRRLRASAALRETLFG